jgi:ankyrin repeat protein
MPADVFALFCTSIQSEIAHASAMDWKAVYPLHASCCEGTYDVAEQLVATGIDVNQLDDDDSGNWSPLHYASWYHQPKIVSLLLAKGANVNSTNVSKSTPLHYAGVFH